MLVWMFMLEKSLKSREKLEERASPEMALME